MVAGLVAGVQVLLLGDELMHDQTQMYLFLVNDISLHINTLAIRES